MASSKNSNAEKQPKKTKNGNAGKKTANNYRLWIGTKGDKQSGLLIIAVAIVIAVLCAVLQSAGVFASLRGSHNESAQIRINEIVSDNTKTLLTKGGDAEDWIEITNIGDSSVNIGKYMLFLDSDVRKVFSFPDCMLAPNEYVIVFAGGKMSSNNGEYMAPFKLGASGGETLILLDAQSTAVDSVVLPELKRDAAYVRTEDGTWQVSDEATPGEKNTVFTDEGTKDSGNHLVETEPGELEISEVMTANTLYRVGENSECTDYIEVHNTSGHSVDLSNWYVSNSASKLKKWALPSRNLGAGEYLLIACDGYDNQQTLRASFKLSGDGDWVYLTNSEGKTGSAVNVPALAANQAYSETGGSWTTDLAPTPGMPNDLEYAAQLNQSLFGTGSKVYINEIAASPSEQSCDWIELYNAAGTDIDLAGYSLSDDASKPRKWQFPAGSTIRAGEYMMICLPGQGKTAVADYINADFALSGSGGYTVSLSDGSGSVTDAVYVPIQYSGISYGRSQNGIGWYYLETPTPGTANNGPAYRGHAAVPEFNVNGGTYKTGDIVTVELSAPAGNRIYYTLDCSDPDEQDILYTGPITVSSTTIIRARAYCDGFMPSYMDGRSFLYDVPDGVRIVSIVSDPAGLYSDATGILAMGPNAPAEYPYGSNGKGANFWMNWEREAHVELFDSDGGMQLSQECGIKLHGQYSRASEVKAFKVFARNEYGKNRFEAKIFSNRDYTSYQSFLVRCAGQDYNKAFMRDVLLTSLASDTSVMYQEADFTLFYINGEFYSLAYLRERISRFSICQFENWEGMEDDLDIIKANEIEKQGSNKTFEKLLAYCKSTDPTTSEFYDTIDQCIDIRNYIEYMAIEIYSGNGDTLNVKRYRNKNTDGKWRWVLFDLDWGFSVDTNSIGRWLKPGGMGTGLYTDNTLFIACMKNARFRDEFLTYFGQQLATTFSSEHVISLIEERYNALKDYLPMYYDIVGIKESTYKKELGKVVSYAKTRPKKLLGYFNDQFKFSNDDLQKYFGDAITAINEYEAQSAS